jgi:holo-[acyl-carrier protein] synthase
MIKGFGVDIVQIPRIEKLCADHAQEKLLRIFLPSEIAYANKQANPAARLAKRFSAKEAFAKACGIGIGRGINFNEIEIINDNLGKPNIILHGTSKETIDKIYNNQYNIFISMSDDYPIAMSSVIIC